MVTKLERIVLGLDNDMAGREQTDKDVSYALP